MITKNLYLGSHEYKEGMLLIGTLKSQAGEHKYNTAHYPNGFSFYYAEMTIEYAIHYPEHQLEIWVSLQGKEGHGK